MKSIGALALALCLVGPAFSQKAAPTPGASPSPSPSAAAQETAPYETQMLRLAEIMGALAILRDLCGERDGAEYRAKFAALMESEATGGERRAKWAGAFNQSFEDYRSSYSSCTPNAKASIASFLAEAEKISETVVDRYGR